MRSRAVSIGPRRRVAALRLATSRLRDVRGFTIAEAMFAVLLAVIAIGALAELFVNANDSSLASQSEVSQLSLAQQQIERIHEIVTQDGFVALALTSDQTAPSGSIVPTAADPAPSPADPNDFIVGYGTSQESYLIEVNYNNAAEGLVANTTSSGEPLLVNGNNGTSGGQLAPVSYADLSTGQLYTALASIPAGDTAATIHTYVTQVNDAGCNTTLGSCGADVRRVIVAVSLNGVKTPTGTFLMRNDTGPQAPTYTTTIFSNPQPSNQPSGASGLRLLGVIQ